MTVDEIRGKFRENASLTLPGDRIDRVIEAVDALESLANVKELVTLCVR